MSALHSIRQSSSAAFFTKTVDDTNKHQLLAGRGDVLTGSAGQRLAETGQVVAPGGRLLARTTF